MIQSAALKNMRFRPQATREQRKDLRRTLSRFQRAEEALDIVRACLPPGFEPATIVCNLQSVHPDRFVLQVRVRSASDEERSYAIKVYSDDFGAEMWALAATLAERNPSNRTGLCLPERYVREERALVFPWVDGTRLSEIVDERKPDLLRRAASLAADLHRTRPSTAPTLTSELVITETLDRCGRLRYRWPSMSASLRPLMWLLQTAAGELDPAEPAVIHGDMAAGQFVWTGERLVLLDMDTAGLSDPAYDVGHFLGQLERRCTLDASLPAHSQTWLASFRAAYPAASLGVSWRNVSFYQGVTLVRKMYTLSRRDPIAGPRLALRLADRAHAALEASLSRASGGLSPAHTEIEAAQGGTKR
jgi:aminoglycoside phosphotransferase (APT) family kinase protein